MVFGGILIAGAVIFIVGHYNPATLNDTIDYIDYKFGRAIFFGDYFVLAIGNCTQRTSNSADELHSDQGLWIYH